MNLTISNVRGPRQMSSIGGTTIREIYSVGPLAAGCAMNITAWSYADQLSISVLTDDQTASDPHAVTDAMTEEFCEIHRSAAVSAAVADTASAQAADHADPADPTGPRQ